MSATAGRPKGEVWHYFKYDEKENTSACAVQLNSRKVKDSNISLCSKPFKGKSYKQSKIAFKKEHTKEYQLLEQEEKKKESERDKRKKSKS